MFEMLDIIKHDWKGDRLEPCFTYIRGGNMCAGHEWYNNVNIDQLVITQSYNRCHHIIVYNH